MWTPPLVTCLGGPLSSCVWSTKRPVVASLWSCDVSGVFTGGPLRLPCMALMARWTRPFVGVFVTCARPFRSCFRCRVVALRLTQGPGLCISVLSSASRPYALSALRRGDVRLRSSVPGLRTVLTCLLSAPGLALLWRLPRLVSCVRTRSLDKRCRVGKVGAAVVV